MLDHFAEWAWVVGDHCRPASERVWAGAKGVGTQSTYDGASRMLTVKDPRGIVFLTNEYDSNGRVSKQTQADNTTATGE